MEDHIEDYLAEGEGLEFVMIGDSTYVIGMTKFLTNVMGYIPMLVVATDDPPDQYRDTILSELADLNHGLKTKVLFESNAAPIWEAAGKSEASLLLGSSLDIHVSRNLGAYHLSVCPPMTDRRVTNNAYCGYRGAMELISDIYSIIRSLR